MSDGGKYAAGSELVNSFPSASPNPAILRKKQILPGYFGCERWEFHYLLLVMSKNCEIKPYSWTSWSYQSS